jgi:nitrite reductase/ring-hydroxylating ferredoxin subunit
MDATLESTIRDRIETEKARTAPPSEAVVVPLIPTERYTDPAFYQLEKERVFARTWLFVGHESEWAESGAYRQMPRSGAPIVVVRGEDDALRAFYNSCRHRGAPVTRDDCGTARRLTCQYHSWSYGLDGGLRAVPDSRSFAQLDKDALAAPPPRPTASPKKKAAPEPAPAAPTPVRGGPGMPGFDYLEGISPQKLAEQAQEVRA